MSWAQVLTEEVGALVGGLSFGKSMRWNGTGAAFSRPVRWLLGLHGETALPFSFAGLQAGAPASQNLLCLSWCQIWGWRRSLILAVAPSIVQLVGTAKFLQLGVLLHGSAQAGRTSLVIVGYLSTDCACPMLHHCGRRPDV